MARIEKRTRIITSDAPMILEVLAHSWEVDHDFHSKAF
jgi:hypothetical protein